MRSIRKKFRNWIEKKDWDSRMEQAKMSKIESETKDLTLKKLVIILKDRTSLKFYKLKKSFNRSTTKTVKTLVKIVHVVLLIAGIYTLVQMITILLIAKPYTYRVLGKIFISNQPVLIKAVTHRSLTIHGWGWKFETSIEYLT